MPALKTSDIATDLSINRRTVEGWIKSGLLKAIVVKKNKRSMYRIKKTDYDFFLKKTYSRGIA
jgi:predicted site-specific integrase-resolvase